MPKSVSMLPRSYDFLDGAFRVRVRVHILSYICVHIDNYLQTINLTNIIANYKKGILHEKTKVI